MKQRLMEIIDGFREMDAPSDGRGWTEHLADHLLANGVIVPPVKLGDKIYVLSASKTKLYLLTITHFVVNKNETQIWAVGAPYASEPAYICNADDLGNNEWVFLTREEEKKALAERGENET